MSPCQRGYARFPPRVILRLPPRSTTTIVAPYRTARVAPWVDTDYRVTFAIRHRREDAPHRTWRDRAVRPPAARRSGRSAVRLELRKLGGVWAPLGRRIRVSGRTVPRLRGEPLRLVFRAWRPGAHDAGPAKVLAHVRTDRRGRFRYAWPARYRLVYEVWATGTRRAAGARSCSAFFRVARRRVRRL